MVNAASHPSFPELLQRFFVDYLRQQRAVSPHTVAAYRDTFRLLLTFAEKTLRKTPTTLTLGDLQPEFILAFLDHLEHDRGNSARSRNARLAAIRSFLKYAAHQDLAALATIQRCLAIPIKRHDRSMLGYLTRPEMDAIIAAPDRRSWPSRRDQVLFALLYNTGGRVSEITNLKIGDVVLDVAPVAHLQGKGRKRRSVPLWKRTATLIRSWIEQLDHRSETDFLFPSKSGRKLSRSGVAQRLALAIEAAAQQYPQLGTRSISPHTIRHTTAMHLLQAGLDITVIALWLGHESPTTTHLYLEADLAMKKEALSRLQPVTASPSRFQPPDQLLAFLQRL